MYTRAVLWTSTALAAVMPTLAPAASEPLEFGGYFTDEAALSRARSAEIYAAALQHVAGRYLDDISADDTRALLDVLEAAGTALPEGQGGVSVANARRLNALGLQAAAADGQFAVWITEGALRGNALGVDVELAAQRLHLSTVGRIRGANFHRDGIAPEAINATLAALLPDAAIGVVLAARSPADILAEDPDATAHRRRPCPAGQHGFGIREERPHERKVRGKGTAETVWSGPWTEVARDCRADETRQVTVAEQCPPPDAGWILHEIEQRIERDPANAYQTRIWREATSSATEIARNCGVNGKRLLTSDTTGTGLRARQCHEVYAAANPSVPAYAGEVDEARSVRVVRSWFEGEAADAVERRYFGPWTETANDCERTLTRPAARTRVRSCPSTFPDGDSQEADTGTETYRDFPTRPEESAGFVWDGSWTVTATTCHRTWTAAAASETRTSGCTISTRTVTNHYSQHENASSPVLERVAYGEWAATGTVSNCGNNGGNGGNGGGNGGNNGGGGGHDPSKPGWDTDGDGDLDTDNPLDVADPITGITPPPDGDCGGGCFQDGYDGGNNGNGNDDDGGNNGGGGICFLTTAVVEMRGEADDGPTLATLRKFRDGWLAETDEGRALIAEYYLVAPRIVEAIPEGHEDWSWIADRVDAARAAILAGDNPAALAIYADMVEALQRRWLHGARKNKS